MGGGSGIGAAAAALFVARGAEVIITGRTRDKLDRVVKGLGERARAVPVDASSPAQLA
jgi:NAD(P)-dependent dehydrogenase (short-subunit alcohol dehydrogenase family)